MPTTRMVDSFVVGGVVGGAVTVGMLVVCGGFGVCVGFGVGSEIGT
ncbi:MAG: hypothetical protein ACE5K0_12700 [Candidatus Methanofastidiosia archaeon]